MSEMTDLNIRIDKNLKEIAEAVFEEMGMDLTMAITVFLRQTLRQGKIPFEIYTNPSYNETDMELLRESLDDMNNGRNAVRKSMEELKSMENN